MPVGWIFIGCYCDGLMSRRSGFGGRGGGTSILERRSCGGLPRIRTVY